MSPSSSSSVVREVLPTNVKPTHYDLELTPDLDKLVFVGKVVVKLQVKEPTSSIVLNAEELEIQAAHIVQDVAKTEQKLASNSITHNATIQTVTIGFVQELPARSIVTLHIQFTGKLNDLMAGFYRSSYTDSEGNKRNMAVTQFEPTDARRAFPCWDEPSLKARFDVTLNVPADLTALSNMQVISEKPLEESEGRLKQVKFATTPIMSTYLLAFVVGDLEYIETFTRKTEGKATPVRCRVYTLKGLKDQGKFGLEVAARTLEVLAGTFDIAYPLPKLDLVAIPDFEAGAMENWGLITYRTSALLLDEKQSVARAKEYVAYVVAHENSHQWFGNLCTMEWWSDLWLNEGFATWVGNYVVDKIFPEWNTWTNFVTEETQRGLSLDALRSSHPIEVDVGRASEISQIFDAISYSKGASVIRMLSSYLGEDVFLSGIRAYLKKHMYGNASTLDLWQALSDASGQDVSQFMELWTRHVGYPVLSVIEEAGEGSDGNRRLRVRQTRFLSTGDVKPEEDEINWWVPLSIITSQNPREASSDILTEKEQVFTLPSGVSFYKLNYQQTGVYRVQYPTSAIKSLTEAIARGDGTLGSIDRLGVIADTASLAPAGFTPTISFLALLRSYENEKDFVIWNEINLRLRSLLSAWSEQPQAIKEKLNGFVRQLLQKQYERLGWNYSESEDSSVIRLRTLVLNRLGMCKHPEVVAEAQRRFKAFFEDQDDKALFPDARSAVFAIAIKNGGPKELDYVTRYYEETTVSDQKMLALSSMGWITDESLIPRVLDYIISDKVRNQDIHVVLMTLGANPATRYQAWEFIKVNWAMFEERYKASMLYFGAIAKAVSSEFVTASMADKVDEFFKTKDISRIDRAVNQTLEKIRLVSAWVARDKNEVAQWLEEHVQ
ncbi:hypothetical protein IWQ61_002423 [Dispira simplex]|nr:hypothetical protein IWQ61_002423 [Dispira simplex]